MSKGLQTLEMTWYGQGLSKLTTMTSSVLSKELTRFLGLIYDAKKNVMKKIKLFVVGFILGCLIVLFSLFTGFRGRRTVRPIDFDDLPLYKEEILALGITLGMAIVIVNNHKSKE